MKNQSIKQALEWLASDDTGSSSKTICFALLGVEQFRISVPSDISDFGRCYRLLQAVPEFKENLHLLKLLNKDWECLIYEWDNLIKLYEVPKNEKNRGLNFYYYIQNILNKAKNEY